MMKWCESVANNRETERVVVHCSDDVTCSYLAKEPIDPLTGVVVGGVDPDDADETDDALQHGSDFARLELCELFTRLLQQGQVGQVGLGLQRALLDRKMII